MITILACVLPGLGPEAGMRWDDLPSAGATPMDTPALANPEAFADRWWVIVASARKAPPAPANLGSTPILLPTSGFANLMPCLEVQVAGTFPTEAAALELREELRARKIDAYAKFAGAWRTDPEVDTYCARLDHPAAGGVTLVVNTTRSAIGVGLPQATIDALAPLTTLAPAGARAWSAPLGIQNAGGWSLGQRVDVVDVVTGERRACAVDGFALQTLGYSGTPDACGTPDVVATLDCALSGEAWIVATPTTHVWTRAPDIDPGRYPFPKHPAEHAIEVWTDGARTRWLVEAWEAKDGPCGGDEDRWWAWVDPATGKRLGPLVDAPFSARLGVVDVDGGEPEVLRSEAFGDVSLWAGETELARRHYNLCICPC